MLPVTFLTEIIKSNIFLISPCMLIPPGLLATKNKHAHIINTVCSAGERSQLVSRTRASRKKGKYPQHPTGGLSALRESSRACVRARMCTLFLLHVRPSSSAAGGSLFSSNGSEWIFFELCVDRRRWNWLAVEPCRLWILCASRIFCQGKPFRNQSRMYLHFVCLVGRCLSFIADWWRLEHTAA